MGKIDKFLAKPQEVEIAGEKYFIKPFTVSDLPMMTRLGSKEESIQAKAMEEAVFKVMKQIDPECNEEQVKGISMEYLTEIMSVINKVNNLDMSEAKEALINKIKKD